MLEEAVRVQNGYIIIPISDNTIYMDTGRFPLYLRQQVRLIKYWLRILRLPADHILKSCYNTLLEMYNVGQKNWCSTVANTLSSCNLDKFWHDQIVEDEFSLIKALKESLYGNFKQQCESQLCSQNDGKKLRNYKDYKSEFCLESYIYSMYPV